MRKLVIACLLLILTTACQPKEVSKSITYDAETGDKIKITLTASENYTLQEGSPFAIEKDNEAICKGQFIQDIFYEQYKQTIDSTKTAKVLEEKETDNLEYILYSFSDKEYKYVIRIKNSNTAIIIDSESLEEEIEYCFKKLSFEIAE